MRHGDHGLNGYNGHGNDYSGRNGYDRGGRDGTRPAGEAHPGAAPPRPGPSGEDVAVIGMAGRFPGAATVEEFWDNLCAGRESIADLTEEELLAEGVPASALRDPAYVRRAAVLDGHDEFDADFFGFSAQAARVLDPQHRLFLQTCWHALEDAALDPARHGGEIGVYGACSGNSYFAYHSLSHHDPRTLIGAGMNTELLSLMAGADGAFIATRVSHALDLRGPSLGVQTACSSALVAVHLACQSLLSGECDVALAGGMTVRVPHRTGYRYEQGAIVSRDGRCRAFDAAATGTVFGSGGAVVVLKPLAAALADGDRVRAVVRGSAVNNDGALKMAFSAPSVDGQARVVAEALAVAGADPDDIGYVEAHGTGTALGDPVETAALAKVFAGRSRPLPIGSVKPNVGHLEYASGMPGLVKAILALEHRVLPPTLHFTAPNPELRLEGTPLRVRDRLGPWEGPPLAGVSSLGAGGTNAHVVLERAPEPPPRDDGPLTAPQVLLVSARGEEELARAAARLGERLSGGGNGGEGGDGGAGPRLDDAAFTLAEGRRAFARRRAVVARTARDAAEALAAPAHPRSVAGTAGDRPPALAFLLPGQGAQYPGMTAGLYASDARYRRELAACAGLFSDALGTDVLAAVLAEREEPLRRTDVAQAALFSVEYALAAWLEPWGVRPAALAGHSVGECAAACLAGVLTLPDAVRMVAARGRLMRQAPPGAMVSVRLPGGQAGQGGPGGDWLAAQLEGTRLEVAAVNEPGSRVVAGPVADVERFAAGLEERGVGIRLLRTPHAFHTAALREVADRFAEEIAGIPLAPPRVPLLSGVTGTWMTDEEAVDRGRWARQIRSAVLFADAVGELLADGRRVLLEVGPGRTLTSAARRGGGWGPGHRAVRTVRHPSEPGDDAEVLALSLGALWTAGYAVDWSPARAGRTPRRVSLPGYPFRRDRHWIPSAHAGRDGEAPRAAAPPLPATAARQPSPVSPAGNTPGDPAGSPSAPGAGGTRGVLTALWSELLGVPEVGPDDNFFDLRGDSLTAVQLAARATAAGLALSPQDVFTHQTVAALADALDRAAADAAGGGAAGTTTAGAADGNAVTGGTATGGTAAARQRPSGPYTGPVPLTPAQLRLLEQPRTAGFCVPLILDVPPALPPRALAEALARVVALHDGLRLRVRRRGGLWEQEVVEPPRSFPLPVITGPVPDGTVPDGPAPGGGASGSTALGGAAPEAAAGDAPDAAAGDAPGPEARAAERIAAELVERMAADALDGGPLLRAAYLPGERPRLVLVPHHLLVDLASERLLLADLNTACADLLAGRPVALPPATTSWARWAARVAELAADPAVHAERELWLSAERRSVRSALGLRPASAPPRAEDVVCLRLPLPAEDTAGLRALQRARRIPLEEAVLAAVAVGHAGATGEDRLLADVEGHGRAVPLPGTDLARTIGSCTTVYPVLLSTGGRGAEGALARTARELRRIPRQGLGHGLLGRLHAPTAPLVAALPRAEVMVSYLGAVGHGPVCGDGPLRPSPGAAPAARSAAACLGNPVELRCYLDGGRMHLDWWYDARRGDPGRLRDWAERTAEALCALAAAATAPARTPAPRADAAAHLTDDELAVLFAEPRPTRKDS